MARLILTFVLTFCTILNATAGPVTKLDVSVTPGDEYVPDDLDLSAYNTSLARRDYTPTVSQLLNDCPKGATGNADDCTFEPDGRTYIVYGYDMTNAERNCDGGTTTFSRGFSYAKLLGSTFSIGGNVGVKSSFGTIPVGISVKVGASYATDYYSKMEVDETDYVNPGSQTAILLQQQYVRHTGRIKVQYGKRVSGHYFWYVNNIDNDVPTTDKRNVMRQWSCKHDPQLALKWYNNHATIRQIP